MKNTKEPFIHITRREGMPVWKGLLIRAAAVLIALIVSAILISAAAPSSKGFFGFFGSLFSGAFGTERRFWILLQNTFLLLGVAVALVVAFKMKFWNLGGNGQVLMGCLAAAICMYYLGGKLPDPLVWLIMLLASLFAGALWAAIPALFKAFFNTNESLFTLMMNYIAMYLVAFFISLWYPNGTGAMPPLTEGALPALGEGQMGRSLLPILVFAVVTAAVYLYLRFSKHGYEVALIGDSKNTARYAGINVRKVIIRTLILSGALCGLVGFLLAGSVNRMVSTTMDGLLLHQLPRARHGAGVHRLRLHERGTLRHRRRAHLLLLHRVRVLHPLPRTHCGDPQKGKDRRARLPHPRRRRAARSAPRGTDGRKGG